MAQNKKPQKPASLLFLSLKTAGLGYGGWLLWRDWRQWGLDQNTRDGLLLPLCVLIAFGVVNVSGMLWRKLLNLRLFIRAVSGDDSRGSADWLSVKEAKALGLHRRRRSARFVGLLQRIPLFLWTETHHLMIGPAGSAKTTASTFNAVASITNSCLISDTKGEIQEVMAPLQRHKGFRIVRFDPSDPQSDYYNAIDRVAEALKANPPEALTLARGIALQLHPEPPQAGENKFFREGARRIISTLILCCAAALPAGEATMSRVYLLLSDAHGLNDLLS